MESSQESHSKDKLSIFSHVTMADIDPIMGPKEVYDKDTSPLKVNLLIGSYVDGEGKSYVFQIVKKVKEMIFQQNGHHEYLFRDGLKQLVEGARRLILGKDCSSIIENKVASLHTIAGTGALSTAFSFIAQYLPRIVYVSSPTWASHKPIIQRLQLKVAEYPYYSKENKSLDFNNFKIFLQNQAVPSSYVLLQTSAHNPTGFDLSKDQWKEIALIMKNKSMIPIFDSAYQGFATGSLDEDAWPVRYFASEGFQMFIAQSFSKNLGLYSERVGALHLIVHSPQAAKKILSQLKDIVRDTYLTPAKYGALIVASILNNKQLYEEWQIQLRDVVFKRIAEARMILRKSLQEINTPGKWDHITNQSGMFSYSGLTQQVCKILSEKYHIYMLSTGRINIAGINENNVQYVASSIKSALEQESASL